MGKIAKEVAGQILSFLGLVLVSVCCGVPTWRATTYVGANIVTGQIVWDGLWMSCVMQSTGQMQCKLIENLLSLTADLQAARALVVISIVVGLIGFIISFIGTKCTSCLKKEGSQANVVITSGFLIIISAVLVLIPLCWSAAVTITDYTSPLTPGTQKRDIGASIYVGWGAGLLLLIGGILFTTSCPPQKPLYGYPPAPVYPYAGPVANTAYGPVYVHPSSRQYSSTGSYVPNKPYAAPNTYSAGQYL